MNQNSNENNQNYDSGWSQPSEFDNSIKSRSPRESLAEIAYKKKENSKTLKSSSEANNPGFVVHSEILYNVTSHQSSSIISSSKSSVGFLKDFYQFVELIKFRSTQKLKEELINASTDVYGPIDMTKKTLLHYACEFNSIEICKVIIEVLFQSNVKQPVIPLREWINLETTNGLTALHFAAYRGNNELIKYLVSLGANVHTTDSDGHNCIHIAAQSDKVNTI